MSSSMLLFAGMEGGGGHMVFKFGEAKVKNIRGEFVKVPFYYNTLSVDGQSVMFEAWVVPAVVFWNIVMSGGPVSQQGFVDTLKEQADYRMSSMRERNELRDKCYPVRFPYDYMVPIGELARVLQDMSHRFQALDGPTRSLLDLDANSTVAGLAHTSVLTDFPQIGSCSLPQDQIDGMFSLKATYPEYYENGTELMAQFGAARQFYSNPPLGSGLKSKVPPGTLQDKLAWVGEFLGYVVNHEGLEPSLEHVANVELVARFLSFKLARRCGQYIGCSANTMLIAVLNLRFFLPLVGFPNACPGVAAIPHEQLARARAWYFEVTAQYRSESKRPENKRRKVAQVGLSEVWDNLENKWGNMLADYEVTCQLAGYWLDVLLPRCLPGLVATWWLAGWLVGCLAGWLADC